MKKAFPVFLISGVILILAALSLFVIWQFRIQKGEAEMERALQFFQDRLPRESSPLMEKAYSMPIMEFEQKEYVAILEVESFGVILPVKNTWDKQAVVPGRFSGNAYEKNLVIGGVDREEQFAFCKKIENGTTLTLTDMVGRKLTYEVSAIDRSAKAEKKWLQKKDCDLTLFCRDGQNLEYIAVRCSLIK